MIQGAATHVVGCQHTCMCTCLLQTGRKMPCISNLFIIELHLTWHPLSTVWTAGCQQHALSPQALSLGGGCSTSTTRHIAAPLLEAAHTLLYCNLRTLEIIHDQIAARNPHQSKCTSRTFQIRPPRALTVASCHSGSLLNWSSHRGHSDRAHTLLASGSGVHRGPVTSHCASCARLMHKHCSHQPVAGYDGLASSAKPPQHAVPPNHW
jgi:hypothetical protein